MWIFIGILLLMIAVLVYFNEGGRATAEIFIVLGLCLMFILLDLGLISAAVIIVWGYKKFIRGNKIK